MGWQREHPLRVLSYAFFQNASLRKKPARPPSAAGAGAPGRATLASAGFAPAGRATPDNPFTAGNAPLQRLERTSLSVDVYADADGDGTRDAGEKPVAGVQVREDLLRRVWGFARPYRKQLVLFLVVLVAEALLTITPTLLIRQIVDGLRGGTDEGHLILDCEIPAGVDLAELDTGLQCVPGVVENGLFLGLAERALLGRPDGGVDVLEAD